MGVADAGNFCRHGHGAHHRGQPIASRLAAVAPRIRAHVHAYCSRALWDVRLRLGEEAAHRRAARITTRPPEGVSTEALGPAMQRRVRRSPISELAPGHLPQAELARRVLRGLVLDHGQPKDLARKHVAGQHTAPPLAPRAVADCHRCHQRHHLVHAALVQFEQHQPSLHRRACQHHLTASGATRLMGDNRRPPRIARRQHSTAARIRGTTIQW